MKVILTGSAGLLGHDVWQVFEKQHEMIAVGRTQPPWVPHKQWQDCDLSDAGKTYSVVTKANPDLIVHCAAYNNVDLAQSLPEEAYRGNSLVTRNLALACQRFDTALMAVSSDYVFSGENAPADGYREFDAPSPISRYGESKRWGEIHVQTLLNKFYLVRTSWLFGPARATWIDHVVRLAQEGSEIKAAKDMVSSPTYTPDLARAMLQLAESHTFGVYHLSNNGFCSRVELAEEVLRLHKRAGYSGLQKLALKDLRLPAPRPPFSVLQNLAWQLQGFKALPNWRQSVSDHFANTKVTS